MNFYCNPLYFGVELPEDGLNEAETCSSNIKLHFFVSNVQSLVVRANSLVEIHEINFVKIPAVGFLAGGPSPEAVKCLPYF